MFFKINDHVRNLNCAEAPRGMRGRVENVEQDGRDQTVLIRWANGKETVLTPERAKDVELGRMRH